MSGIVDASEFPPERVHADRRGRRVSVIVPARDEEATVGAVVATIRGELMERHRVVDELIVVDDGSSDATAEVAEAAGATVVAAASVLPEYGTEHGKGQAMWRGLHVSSGDIVAYCDADIRAFGPEFVLGVVGPLLASDDAAFAKGFYTRPLDGRDGEGGRVTELSARPLIALLFPHLASMVQPLAGECAGRREVLEAVPFVGGYGVDLGLLIDVTARFGPDCIVQSDLGRRVHRNRPLHQLSAQSLAIWQLGLERAGLATERRPATLERPSAEPLTLRFSQRPPLAEIPAHRKTA
ncbi:glucosyl-3-phosphoglycerate synthase [Acidiferrimicrobium sp. IK]|uniref:glucosyl-3-phosphoglycerate synthase n=1 Tax=Acidiferrimicrobium sp. IK TaxID=2871700 RepID=UPI0021CB7F74|nr:glucosyl-3-phosphoglycerate synthase [Acidiferrimicrobium sp. IK]MCU4186902.1 glucosyl-3-phosphoglycerate synthase [Acidiferrimicrobium sp. IK]